MDYSQIIRNLREDHDLSQADIAKIIGTSKNQIGKYERGEQEMPIRHLITLCNHYKVSADFVLGLPKGRPYGLSKTKHETGSIASEYRRGPDGPG